MCAGSLSLCDITVPNWSWYQALLTNETPANKRLKNELQCHCETLNSSPGLLKYGNPNVNCNLK